MILLRRYFEDRTEGKWIFPDDSFLYNLERPDLNNKPFVSCIPEGTYIVQEDSTGVHQWFRFLDVPHRSFIEMHPANSVDQLEGCLAPCMELRKGKAYNSRKALMKFKQWFPRPKQKFIVHIKEWNEEEHGPW